MLPIKTTAHPAKNNPPRHVVDRKIENVWLSEKKQVNCCAKVAKRKNPIYIWYQRNHIDPQNEYVNMSNILQGELYKIKKPKKLLEKKLYVFQNDTNKNKQSHSLKSCFSEYATQKLF